MCARNLAKGAEEAQARGAGRGVSDRPILETFGYDDVPSPSAKPRPIGDAIQGNLCSVPCCIFHRTPVPPSGTVHKPQLRLQVLASSNIGSSSRTRKHPNIKAGCCECSLDEHTLEHLVIYEMQSRDPPESKAFPRKQIK